MNDLNLRPELLEAARWLEEQLATRPFADAGFMVSQHGGQISRVEYTVTEKRKPSSAGTEGG